MQWQMHALGQALWGFQESPHSSLHFLWNECLDVPRHAFDNAPRLRNFLKARAHKELFRGSLGFAAPLLVIYLSINVSAVRLHIDRLIKTFTLRQLP
jgi:hypothetical protein